MDKNNFDISTLEIKEIGLWPLPFRIAVLIAVSIVVMFLSYNFILKNSFNALDNLKSKEVGLRSEFVDIYGKSLNLSIYKNQMVEIQKMLQVLLLKLPSKGEIPMLLEDISQQALSAGLEFELIKPEDSVDKGFYVEQPVKMTLIGKYHGFGNFIAGLSKLPRIVTLHDFVIKKQGNITNNTKLVLNILAKTYWYNTKEKL